MTEMTIRPQRRRMAATILLEMRKILEQVNADESALRNRLAQTRPTGA